MRREMSHHNFAISARSEFAMNLIVCFLVETRGLGKEFFLEGYISHHLGGLEYCNINRDAYKDR